MAISDIINSVSSLISLPGQIDDAHDHIKHLSSKIKLNSGIKRYDLDVEYPKQAYVGEPVVFRGTGWGIIRLYSQTRLERDNIIPNKEGIWYVREYFSVPGEYELTFKDRYKEKKITMEILEK
jgi:hypothetical protein